MMVDKKIAFIIGSLSGGGAEQVCVTVANNFANNNYKVELIVLHLNNSKYMDRVSHKVNLINLNTNKVRYSLIKLIKYLNSNKPDVCFIFDYRLTLLVNIYNLFIRKKIKIVSRCVNTLSYKLKTKNLILKYLNKFIVKFTYTSSNVTISQSEGMKNDLVDYFKINENKIIVINNPLNKLIETHFNDDIVKKDNYLLYIGRLETQKNIKLALKAFSIIKRQYPDLILKISGLGSLKDELVSFAEQLDISECVDFLGFVSGEKLIDLYKRANLTLLTSFYEGFPNVLIESIALGTPVVSVNCFSGPSEIIIENVNGILVNSYKIEDFTKAIKKGLDRNWNYKSIIETSVRYQSDYIVNKYIKIVDGLLC